MGFEKSPLWQLANAQPDVAMGNTGLPKSMHCALHCSLASPVQPISGVVQATRVVLGMISKKDLLPCVALVAT